MTFLGVLRGACLRQVLGVFVGGLTVLGHLHDNLDATLIGHARGQKLSDRGGKGVLAPIGKRSRPLAFRSGFQRHSSPKSLFGMSRHAQHAPPGFGDRLFMSLAILQPITDMGDRQLISRPQSTDLDTLPIDANAIRAAQISDKYFAILLRHTAMMTRHTQRIKSRVTSRMAPHDNHSTIQSNIWTFIEGHQS